MKNRLLIRCWILVIKSLWSLTAHSLSDNDRRELAEVQHDLDLELDRLTSLEKEEARATRRKELGTE